MKPLIDIIIAAIAWIAGSQKTTLALVEENQALTSNLASANGTLAELKNRLKEEEDDDAALLTEIDKLNTELAGATARAAELQADIAAGMEKAYDLAKTINLRSDMPVVDAAFNVHEDVMFRSLDGVPPVLGQPAPANAPTTEPPLESGPIGEDGPVGDVGTPGVSGATNEDGPTGEQGPDGTPSTDREPQTVGGECDSEFPLPNGAGNRPPQPE